MLIIKQIERKTLFTTLIFFCLYIMSSCDVSQDGKSSPAEKVLLRELSNDYVTFSECEWTFSYMSYKTYLYLHPFSYSSNMRRGRAYYVLMEKGWHDNWTVSLAEKIADYEIENGYLRIFGMYDDNGNKFYEIKNDNGVLRLVGPKLKRGIHANDIQNNYEGTMIHYGGETWVRDWLDKMEQH